MGNPQTRVIPFKYHGNSLNPDVNNRHRLKLYRKFIGRDTLQPYIECEEGSFYALRALDVGEPGYISRELRVLHNTEPCDLNYALVTPNKAYNYDVVTCFEVLNHVMNPLQLMERIWNVLDSDGICYLSVPKLWLISWHHCKHNFVMYDPKRLNVLFEYAGFEVIRSVTRNPWPWWFMFWGFRPFFRVLFNRIEIWELRKRSKQ